MGLISKLVSLVNENSQIKHTDLTNILTKYGMFQAKMYKHNQREYLVILSNNFFECSAPIFYIHSDCRHPQKLDWLKRNNSAKIY
jgi:hypothetical protein